MLRVLPFLFTVSLLAQYAPTHCRTTTDTVMGEVTVKILLACSDGFADDVLWHLDRVDQVPSSTSSTPASSPRTTSS